MSAGAKHDGRSRRNAMKPALLVVAIMVLSCGGATAQDAWQTPRTPD
jgi:hypothetical protein